MKETELKKYDKYKPSGVEWIGEIPKHWEISRVKNAFNRKKLKAKQEDPTILSLTSKGIVVRDISYNEGQIAESYFDYNPVDIGDLLLNPMDLVTNAFSSVSKLSGVISPAYFNLTNKKRINSRYFDYYFKLQYWNKSFFAHGKGVSWEHRWTLNQETLMNFPIPLMDESEQTAIANYLDDKTAKIDTLIEKKKKLIELYKEERTAVINQAVTRGINPNVKLKESGIDWLGKIPEHWEVKKLKYVAKIFGRIGYRGYTVGDMVNEGEGAITISPSNMKDWLTDFSNCSYLSWAKYEESPEIKIYNSDILFVKTGSTFGKTAMVRNLPQEATINPQLIVFKSIKCNAFYFLYLFQSNVLQDQVKTSVIGGTIPTISQEKIYNYLFLLPPKDEQLQIVQHIEAETKRIDDKISKTEKEISLLQEYRTALIYEVVTGKIKVC